MTRNGRRRAGGAEPSRRRALLKNAGHVLTGVLVAAAIAVICLQWGQIRALAGRVEALEAKTAALEAQAGQPAGLDASLPLVADFDFTAVRNTDSVYSFATLRLNVTPAQPVEGLKLTFTFRPSEGKPTSVEAVDLGGGSYRADVTLMDAVTPISVTLTLDDGRRQYVQALARITSITENGCTWDARWRG